MNFHELICRKCGSNDFTINHNIATCTYCGTKYWIDKHNRTVKQPIFICPQCGFLRGYYHTNTQNNNHLCIFCMIEMQKLQPEVSVDEIIGLSDAEIDEFRLLLQNKNKFNQHAWVHRERMTDGVTKKSYPISFDYKFHKDTQHIQCPYCNHYWTEKRTTLFKKEYWHCYFCDKDFKE